MTNEEAKKMLKAKLECLKNETSGINYDCNMRLCDGCSLNYEQGNMGEQKEALDMAIKALEQQPCEDCVSRAKAIEICKSRGHDNSAHYISELPSVTPSYNSIKPELKPCEDCISRQVVKDMLTAEWTKYVPMELDINLSFVLDKISVLPSVTPQPKWIPVSERLPSDGKYLVTRGDVIGRPMIGMRYFSKDLSKVDEFDFVDKKGISGWCEYDSEYGWYIDDKVTAWMPLPEPMRMDFEHHWEMMDDIEKEEYNALYAESEDKE